MNEMRALLINEYETWEKNPNTNDNMHHVDFNHYYRRF